MVSGEALRSNKIRILESVKASHESDLREKTNTTNQFMVNNKNDIQYLSKILVLEDYTKILNTSITSNEINNKKYYREKLVFALKNFARSKPKYLQIRILNNKGDETINVGTNRKGIVKEVKIKELQNKSKRKYFKEAIKTEGHMVSSFIKNWLIVHIQNIDMRYANFSKEEEVKIAS